MTVSTPGYILEISDHALVINGQEMPFTGPVEAAIDLIMASLSELTLSGGAPGGLGVVLKDNRAGGLGEVTRTIQPGTPVTLSTFKQMPMLELALSQPPVEPSMPVPASTPAQAQVTHLAPEIVTPPAPQALAASEAAVVEPEQPVRMKHAPPLSPFARLAQSPSLTPSEAATSPLEPLKSPTSQTAHTAAPEAPAPRHETAQPDSPPIAAPAPAVEPHQAKSPVAVPPSMPTELSPVSLEVVDRGTEGLEPAADEIDFKSIFKEEGPIIDEGIRTPIGKSLTARQRTEGFSLKSNARREIERRRDRKRKLIFTTVAAVTLIAALRIVGAVMAGPSGDYAAICVDARTTLRLPNATCTTSANPFAQTLYLAVGDRVPPVNGKSTGGSTQKPTDPRSINSQVPEGKDGVVLDGGEVK